MVLLILLDDDFTSKLPLGQVVGVNSFEAVIKSNHGLEVLAKLSSCWYGHQDLVLSSIWADLGHLDEPSSCILFHIQVEPFGLQDQGSRGQVATATTTPSSTAASSVSCISSSSTSAAANLLRPRVRNRHPKSLIVAVTLVVFSWWVWRWHASSMDDDSRYPCQRVSIPSG